MGTIDNNRVECTHSISIFSDIACCLISLYGKKDHAYVPGLVALYLDEQKTKFQALNKWFFSEQGSIIAQAFSSELTLLKDLLYGDTFLQLGSLGDDSLAKKLRYQHKWVVTPDVNADTTIVALLNQLPIDRNSVDCIIAPLTMDAFSSEKNPIDEMDRILKPMGHIVFFGINPFSLWGAWLRLAHKTCFGETKNRPKSVLSIKRAMLHRGYIQCHLSSFYYIPPFAQKKWIDKFEILNVTGKMISAIPAGFYCLVVQKHEENLIPLIPVSANEKYRPSVAIPLQPTCRE